MKHFVLFFFFMGIVHSAFSLELNLSSADLGVNKLEEDSPKPNPNIRTLPDIKIPSTIVIKSPNNEFNEANQSKPKQDILNNNAIPDSANKIKKEDIQQKTTTNNQVLVETSSPSSATGGGGTNGTEKFCEVYDRKIYDLVKMYRIQIQKMDNVSSTNTDPQKYFCRAFSNLMLMEENTDTPNKTYIANAKSDMKKAIAANKLVTGVFKIDVIEDRFLTAIFDKYNQIATKGMDDEQKALISDAIKQPQLLALKQQLDERYGEADYHAGTEGTLKDKETADLTPYYTKNQLPLLNSVKDANGDITAQTQALRDFRVTEGEMQSTEARIDEMLTVIEGLDASEK